MKAFGVIHDLRDWLVKSALGVSADEEGEFAAIARVRWRKSLESLRGDS